MIKAEVKNCNNIVSATVHLRKNHFHFSKQSGNMILAVIFIAIESLFQKYLLADYSPIALYFFRCGILFVIFWMMFNPNFLKAPKKSWLWLLWSALLSEGMMVLRFYGFATQGIVFTVLILILSPFLVYLFSFIFLKEKPSVKIIVGAMVVILAIIYATIMGR